VLSLYYDFALLKDVSCLFIVGRMIFVIDIE